MLDRRIETTTATEAGEARLNPFLHVEAGRIYDPLTDRACVAGEPLFATLRGLLQGELASLTAELRRELLQAGWLLRADDDPARRFRLKYASIETQTGCNQACSFCPVSVAPRPPLDMPTDLFERIVSELAAFRSTLDGVALVGYNEPTADPRLIDQLRSLRAAGLPPALLTNGTGLTPARVAAILELGGLRYLSVNLSTLDRDRYKDTRGGDHLGLVLRNLDALSGLPLAPEMDVAVLGSGDEQHRRDFEAIRARYSASRLDVRFFQFNDRAGMLPAGLSMLPFEGRLRGCDHLGSRPLQHVHVTAHGHCVLCCQDYTGSVQVGDLRDSTLQEVLTGERFARARRQVYGLEQTPPDFICRRCVFALRAPDQGPT